eukprot:TRINITY_DN31018_c4_g1_i1.p1 TRINITY_DN31018_c4_g1~~TRINITY_DN31018_c4_g1_i1.p1  ORF type:complete len:120 (+),score=6.80 TRINITY_DN31018_c4_g1_i1:640-999(+)
MWKMDSSRESMLTNKVTIHLNMLGPFMKNWTGCYLYGTYVICIEWSRTNKKDTKFPNKSSMPKHFATCKRHRRYSASANDFEIVVCFLLIQKINEVQRNIHRLMLDLLVSGQLAQSASK